MVRATAHRIPLIALLLAITTAAAAAAVPAPQSGTQFTIPLADGSSGSAVILTAPDGRSHLVYATPSGSLAVLEIGPPVPGPEPPPTPLTTLRVTIVEDPAAATFEQRQVLSDKTWREYLANKHEFLGIVPADLIDPTTNLPPPHLAPALSAAKDHELPVVLIFDTKNQLHAAEPLPKTAAELLSLFQRYARRKNHDPNYQRIQLQGSRTRTPPAR